MSHTRHNRREFINVTGAALAALAGAPELAAHVQASQAAAPAAGELAGLVDEAGGIFTA